MQDGIVTPRYRATHADRDRMAFVEIQGKAHLLRRIRFARETPKRSRANSLVEPSAEQSDAVRLRYCNLSPLVYA